MSIFVAFVWILQIQTRYTSFFIARAVMKSVKVS